MGTDRIANETPGKAFRAIAEFRGIIRFAAWLATLSFPVLLGVCCWLCGRVVDGSEINRVQDSKIDTIQKRADEDRDEARQERRVIFDKLERIAERVGAAR